MGGAVIAVRLLSLFGSIALARLLAPSDFGQVALAMVLLGTTGLFVGLGMAPAVIHSDEDEHVVAFHAFIITATSGIFLFGLFSIGSRLIVDELGDVNLEIFQSLLPLVLVTAMTIVPGALLRKNLLFGRFSLANILNEVIYFPTAILLTWLGYGVWSLIYGRLISAFIQMILLWVFNPRLLWIKPVPWDWQIFKGLLRYGLPVTGSGLVSYFHSHWDDWFVGRHFGNEALGYYSKSYELSNNTLSQFSSAVIANVFLPTYTKIRGEIKRVMKLYLRSLRVVLLMMTPLSLGLFVLAGEIVGVVLGPKWLPMVDTLQLYCLMAFLLPISYNVVPLFQALGKPQYNLYAGIVLSVVMVPLVLILSAYNYEGVAAAVVISHAVGVAYNIFMVDRLIPGTLGPTLKLMLLYLVLGGIMMAGVYFAKPFVEGYFGGTADLFALIVLVLIGAVIYCGLIALTQWSLVVELLDMFRDVLRSRKAPVQSAVS